jgi:hypothetical protein
MRLGIFLISPYRLDLLGIKNWILSGKGPDHKRKSPRLHGPGLSSAGIESLLDPL